MIFKSELPVPKIRFKWNPELEPELNSESNPNAEPDRDSVKGPIGAAIEGAGVSNVGASEVGASGIGVADAAMGSEYPDANPFLKLDERNIQVDRISSLIFATILFFGAIFGLVFLIFAAGISWVWFTALAVGSAIVLGMYLLAIFWPPLSYKNTTWRLDHEGFEIHHGVLWKHRVIIPLGRVQHADVSQGPLQRQFGVGTLTIHTAGTQHASIPLEGLTHETALELRDMIVHQKKGQHVV